MKSLIIVESPTKARTLERFLGPDFLVLATMGHIRDLPKKTLGIDLKKDFKPEYVDVAKKKEAVDKIITGAKKAKTVILATDPDREGEAIAWHASHVLAKNTNISRIVFHEITKPAIEEALTHPGKVNLPLVHAQQARRVLDRLVGYLLSPLLWRKIRRGLSAGRVQSVAVRLIVEREREIGKFKPEEYWEIEVELKKKEKFIARLVRINDKKAEIKNKKTADEVVSGLRKGKYEIVGVENKELLQRSAPPFTTSTLQQRANVFLGFTSKRTMRTAQSLYEKGLITYHRTDSLALSGGAVEKIRQFITREYGPKYLPSSPVFYKTKSKVAQEAHEAIRPTGENGKWQMANDKLETGDEKKLYELIWKRTLASQMNPAVWDLTKVKINNDKFNLLADGKKLKFLGWLTLFGKPKNGDKVLPELKTGDRPELVKVLPSQKFTEPPGRFTEASLIKTLEEKGIGRPSTYAPIISTIQIRQYVEKDEGKFLPTPLGTTVNDFLLEHFEDVFDYDFTALMENNLDEIARGEKKWQPVIKDFYDPFSQKLEKVGDKAKRVAVPAEKTGEKCPECKTGDLIIRSGRFGKFIACSRFPECKYTAAFTQKLDGLKCPKCKGEVIIKRTKKGRQFYGCSAWPKCDWASWKKPK